MTVEERRAQNIQEWKDFFAFKINLFPIIVKILYALLVVVDVIYGFKIFFDALKHHPEIDYLMALLGMGIVVLGPILLHITFELLLLLFSIVDLLREIRDNIFKILENQNK